MGLKVAINGFGRIGRNVLRASLGDPAIEILAINDLSDAKTLGHLLKYDSVHGRLREEVEAKEGALFVGGKSIRVLKEKEPEKLPWKELGIELVVESTGRLTDRAGASRHLSSGARKVLISAPAKQPDITVVLGVNEERYDATRHHIISNASCTTNCLAPLAKVLLRSFGIKRAQMTTVHSYTNDQQLLDLPHKDLRRARAAALSMIPTTTGAARALSEVIPELEGKMDGMAIRVPTPNVSVIDLVAELERDVTEQEANAVFRKASEGELSGILQYTEEALVSVDLNGNSHSCIVDSTLTKVVGARLIKVVAWYDNEWAYSCRVRDLAKFIAQKRI